MYRNNNQERDYLNLLKEITETGCLKSDRTGTGTLSLFTRMLRFDISDTFPIFTTKEVYWRKVITELLWFLRGDTNVKYLEENDVKFWSPFADDNGDIGPLYGKQWTGWNDKCNQIDHVLHSLRFNKDSRRHVVCAWNAHLIPRDEEIAPRDNVKNNLMSIAPCHCLFQFYRNDQELSCTLYQRSADMFLGVPFNIPSYSLLTMMIAKRIGCKAKEFIWVGGDCHIYVNHLESIKKQLSRLPYDMPTIDLQYPDDANWNDIDVSDFIVHNYQHHSHIKGKLNV